MRLDSRSKDADMSSTISTEMQAILRMAAEPASPGESVKAAINRAARRLQLGYRRARAIWYEEARIITAEEADRLRAARAALREERLLRLDAEMALLRAQIGDAA